jgi:predicted acylesterase/phospholipase RssA
MRSGGLIVIGTFIMRWDIYRCIETFDTLARRVFRRPLWFNGRFWGRLRDLIRCVVSDGVYDAKLMEQTLREIFGAKQPMFGYARGYSAKKVLVTATDTENSSTVVFGTYNGAGAVDKKHRKCSVRQQAVISISSFARV